MFEPLILMLMNIPTLRHVVDYCIVAGVSVKRIAPALRFKQSEKMEGP
jgi:hypothetical protein